MREKCKTAVETAIGRPITQAEAEGIEQRIRAAQTSIARRDPSAWHAKPAADRLTEAADLAATWIGEEAQAKQVRAALNVAAQARVLATIEEAKTAGKSQAAALYQEINRSEAYRKGVEKDLFRQMTDTIQAINSRWLGMVEDARVAKAFIDEVFGKDSGSAIAKQVAAAWREVAETARTRANRSGATIGRLDYGYIPQSHSQVELVKAGRGPWVDATLPMLNPSRYLNPDGTPMSEVQLRGVLAEAWEEIVSGGLAKAAPDAFIPRGASLLSTPSAKHRALHFKGPDEFFAYSQQFGDASIVEAMQGHLSRLARDIAYAETLGPNWQQTFNVGYGAIKESGASTRLPSQSMDVQTVWKAVTGEFNRPVWARFSDVWQGARNLEVSGKLGGAFLSSVVDPAFVVLTSRFHRLPMLTLAGNIIRSFGSEAREFADRSGLVADSMIRSVGVWTERNLTRGWTGRLADATMRASFLTTWTESMTRAYSLTMMGGLGKLSRTDWGALRADDAARLKRAGFTQEDWAVLQRATPEDWQQQKMLTPEAVYAIADPAVTLEMKQRAVTRLLGFITEEGEYAVIKPDLRVRTIQTGGTQRGTAPGEIWRSSLLFKGYPMAVISRHVDRFFNDETLTKRSRLEYVGLMMTMTTLLGYWAMSSKDISRGEDPRPLDDPKTWKAAFLQGGGLGIFGDFLFADYNRFDRSIGSTVAGPLLGDLWEGAKVAGSTVQSMVDDNPRTNPEDNAAKALRLAMGVTPGVAGLHSLWYTRAALERAWLHDMNELLSPGYMSRMQARTKRDRASDYWWQPGNMEPDRAPDLARALGAN